MRFSLAFAVVVLLLAFSVTACVDSLDLTINQRVDVVVVDATLTNLAEPQTIRLNRSQADRLTGRFGSVPITKATVEVVVDSTVVVPCHETEEGTYQLPSDFKGRVGHVYQLRFTLPDGTHYVSTRQVMPAVPPIEQVSARFNLNSLPAALALAGGYRAGHDFSVSWHDPVDQVNYYQWEWRLWEKQDWCRSCQQGVYAVNNILPHVYKDGTFYVSGTDLYEDCFVPDKYVEPGQPPFQSGLYVYDYPCRTNCWEILYSSAINVFADQYTNGNEIRHRTVAQIPYYDTTAVLVEIRQLGLTASAYAYFNRFANQTQVTGGIADTPTSAPVGNVQNTADASERVVGYFTASAVSTVRYWLDRTDAQGLAFGQTDPLSPPVLTGSQLFYALNLRQPNPEPIYPYPSIRILGGPARPPTAVCLPSDSKTPFKPVGWRD